MLLSLRLFSADTKIAQLIIYCIVVLAGFSWVEWIYHRRGKTVMKHYSKRSFYPIIGILLFLIPFAIIFTMAYYCFATNCWLLSFLYNISFKL